MKKPNWNELSSFVRGYLTCAYWTSDPKPGQGEYAKERECHAKTTAQSVEKAVEDCALFQRGNATDLELSGVSDDKAGHNLWLSRNGHGSGWFDEYSITDLQHETEYAACRRLQVICRTIGERHCDFYRGRIYLS